MVARIYGYDNKQQNKYVRENPNAANNTGARRKSVNEKNSIKVDQRSK